MAPSLGTVNRQQLQGSPQKGSSFTGGALSSGSSPHNTSLLSNPLGGSLTSSSLVAGKGISGASPGLGGLGPAQYGSARQEGPGLRSGPLPHRHVSADMAHEHMAQASAMQRVQSPEVSTAFRSNSLGPSNSLQPRAPSLGPPILPAPLRPATLDALKRPALGMQQLAGLSSGTVLSSGNSLSQSMSRTSGMTGGSLSMQRPLFSTLPR